MRHLNGWRDRRRRRASGRQLHLALGELSAHVRAGRALAQAVGEVAGDMPEPICGSMREAAEAIAVGTSPGEALGALAGGDDGALLAAAITVQARAGGDLAALLDDLADALVEREAQRRLAAGITAQARATARMVACMPLAALAGLWLPGRRRAARAADSPTGLGGADGIGRADAGRRRIDQADRRRGGVIRLALLAAAVALVEAARRSWRHDRVLNGRAGRAGTDRLAMLAGLGRSCGPLAAMLPAPPLQRDHLRERAGVAGVLDDRAVREARLGAMLLMGVVGIAGWSVIGSFAGTVLASACAGFGWLYPDLWLRAAAARRADQIERQAPVVLDLIAATVAAGVSLDNALVAAAQAGVGPLQLEFQRVAANLALGRRRGDELRDLAQRTGSPSLTRLATALRVSDRLGVPLADGLRRQAGRARAEQSLRVQERAATAAPRILLVVVLVLVPASLLPVLAALALTALGSAGGLGL